MAKDLNTQNNNVQQPQHAQPTNQYQPTDNAALYQMTPRGSALSSDGSGVGPVFMRDNGLANELLNRFTAELNNYNKTVNAIQLNAVLMDAETSKFPATMVLVYHVDAYNTAYVQPLILEASISQMPNLIEQVEIEDNSRVNHGYSYSRTTQETIHLEAAPSQILMSPNFAPTAIEHLRRTNDHIEHVIVCGGSIIPRHFNVETQFIPLCYYACQAVIQVLAISQDQYLKFMDVGGMKRAPLSVKIAAEPGATHETSTGKKIAAPIAISIDQQLQQQVNTFQGAQQSLGYLFGYMDLLYTAPTVRAAYANEMRNRNQLQRSLEATRYRPMFVITMTDRPESHGINLEHFIVNAAMVVELERSGRWAEAFYRPERREEVNPLQDFGAIGYEVNPMDPENGKLMPIKTDGVEYSLATHVQLVNTVCFPSLEVAIDVPLCGDVAFMENMIAVKGMLIQAAVNLFGTQMFGQEYDCHEPDPKKNKVVKMDLGLFPAGSYTNQRGESRDIREVYNYLGWLNFTQGDEARMKDWSMLNEDNFYIGPKAQKMRYDQMMNITQGTFKQDDIINRLVLDEQFLAAVYRCMVKSGIGIYSSATTMQQANIERGNAYWGVAAGMTPASGMSQAPQQGRRGGFQHGYVYNAY